MLLFAFRDLWKEWGDSNFHIFFSFTELAVSPQAAGVVGTFNVLDPYSILSLSDHSTSCSIDTLHM